MGGSMRIEREMTLEGSQQFLFLSTPRSLELAFSSWDSCALSWAGLEAMTILHHPLKSCTHIRLPQSFLPASIISCLSPRSLARWPAYSTLSTSQDKFVPQAFSLTT